MKKHISAVVAIGMFLTFGTIAMAGTGAGTGIQKTSHDLSSLGAGANFGDSADQGGQNRICVYCHAPHNTIKADVAGGTWTYMPLWNHGKTTYVGQFNMYSNGSDVPGSTQHQASSMNWGQPGSVSLLCLSCHDGSVATNMYGSGSSIGGNDKKITDGTGRAAIGLNKDLSNHHPIGFDYDQVQAMDDEIRPSTAAGFLTDATYGTKNNGPQHISDLLWLTAAGNNNLECVSCHDVHNTKNGGAKFTWVDDNNSRLCLTCHKKDGVDRP